MQVSHQNPEALRCLAEKSAPLRTQQRVSTVSWFETSERPARAENLILVQHFTPLKMQSQAKFSVSLDHLVITLRCRKRTSLRLRLAFRTENKSLRLLPIVRALK